MKIKKRKSGSVMVITVFVIAVLATLVGGMLTTTIEQLKILQNQSGSQKALQVAEAGINDAMASIRTDPNWAAGFSSKAFGAGSYTVTVNNTNLPVIIVKSTAVSEGYTANMTAKLTVADFSPYNIRIDNLRANNYE